MKSRTVPERIAVGVDSEAPSLVGAKWAAHRAAARGSSIELITAIDGLANDPLDVADRLAAVKAVVLEIAPDIDVTTLEVEGSIRNVLLQRSQLADLLVLGFHRSRPIRSALAGSVSLGVSAESGCPTVVVPDDWDEGAARDSAVVVGLEADGSSDAAIEFAANEVGDGRDLHLVHAWRLPLASVDALEALVVERPQDIAWHREVLSQAGDRVREDFPEVVVREQLTESFPARALVEAARHASLVVVGTHGRGQLGTLVLGSTARDVMYNSTTPVCVVPTADDEQNPHRQRATLQRGRVARDASR
jgi:nucleotide-binding universal stress UspA family protein